MLSLIVVAIMMGYPTAFTLMGLGMVFGYIAFWVPDAHWYDNRVFDLIAQRTYGVMTNDTLLSVPLFVFMGYIMERAALVDRMFHSVQLAFRRVPASLAVTTLLVWIGVSGERLATGVLMTRLAPPRREVARTLFVGTPAACRDAMTGGPNAGFVDVATPPAADALGHIENLPALLHDSRADTVVVCSQLSDERMRHLVETTLAAGCRLLIVPQTDAVGSTMAIVWQGDRPLIEVTTPALKGRQLFVKRAVDIIGALLGLTIAAPVMLLVAVAVKLDSAGPVIFGQERVGTGGRRFRVLKFRTMRHGAPDTAHRELIRRLQADDQPPSVGERQVYKLTDDERVTRVGRWLRRTSLDELPQLLNVLRGEMSLVGPRPPLPYEFEGYDHWQFDRLQLRPGITGLWQVSGRSRLSYRQMCELDVEYVRRWSLALDVEILLRTIPVVLFNSGRAA